MIEVFWSTSTCKSKKSSSLLETVSQLRQRVSDVRIPWNISWTHVGSGCEPASPAPHFPPAGLLWLLSAKLYDIKIILQRYTDMCMYMYYIHIYIDVCTQYTIRNLYTQNDFVYMIYQEI